MRALSGFNNPQRAGALYALDVRAKLLCLLLVSVTTLLLSGLPALALLGAVTFLFACLLKRFRVLFAAYAFLALMFLIAFVSVQVLIKVAPGMAADFTFDRLAVPFLRACAVMNILIPVSLTANAQKLLGALKALRLPLYVYLPCAVMIRFIPAFINDIRQILEAMRVRGFELSAANVLRHPLTACRMAFVPLIFLNLRTAEDLGIACELKGIGRGPLTPAGQSRLTGRDYALMAAAVLICAFCVCFEIQSGTALGRAHP